MDSIKGLVLIIQPSITDSKVSNSYITSNHMSGRPNSEIYANPTNPLEAREWRAERLEEWVV